MPFPRRTPKAQPQDREPLLRLGGLYPNDSGTSIMGNVHVGSPRRGEEVPLGTDLIDLIERAMEQQRPLRLLIFEDNGKFPNAPPYTIHATLGRANGESQATAEPEAVEEAPAPAPPPPPFPTAPARPMRRTAPRR